MFDTGLGESIIYSRKSANVSNRLQSEPLSYTVETAYKVTGYKVKSLVKQID